MSAALAGILRQSQAVARLWQKRFNRVGSGEHQERDRIILDELSGKETFGEGCYFDIDVKGLPVNLRAGEMIPLKP